MMPMGRSRCGLLALLGGGRDRIEADVGEEDDRAAGQHARPAVGHERMPVGRVNEADAPAKTKTRMATSLSSTIDVVGLGRLANAAHQHHCEQHHDEERRNVEAEVPAGIVDDSCPADPAGRRADRRARSTRGRMQAEPIQQIDDMRGKAHAHGHVAEPAYSRIRSQPMIQAISSPSVA